MCANALLSVSYPLDCVGMCINSGLLNKHPLRASNQVWDCSLPDLRLCQFFHLVSGYQFSTRSGSYWYASPQWHHGKLGHRPRPRSKMPTRSRKLVIACMHNMFVPTPQASPCQPFPLMYRGHSVCGSVSGGQTWKGCSQTGSEMAQFCADFDSKNDH